jgi:predicted Fe-Mo cluster-binding NifX family protein
MKGARYMKVCITSKGNTTESEMDPRFGRSEYFIFTDTEKKDADFEIIENPAAKSGGGAGIASGQLIIDKGVNALITGNLGPNAMSVLKESNIELYRGLPVSVKKNIESFIRGGLVKITDTVQSHFGIK